MKLKETSTEQKLKGAYYTPLQLADIMIGYYSDYSFERVLEPSCGDGVFLDSLYKANMLSDVEKLVAIEIEKDEANKVAQKYESFQNVEILQKDFFDFYKETTSEDKYDLIVGNPPYIRYQYLSEKQKNIQAQILTSHGMKSNKLINAWVAFLVACVQLLTQNGKILFVIPAEILQVAYAEDLRLYLSNNLSKITLITFDQLVFPDIKQEVVVLIGEKTTEEKGIRIIATEDLESLKDVNLSEYSFREIQHVKEKWTKYFINAEEMRLIQSIKDSDQFVQFSEYGVINVGITTGNNKYFSVDKNIEEKYDLGNVTIPLIGRGSHAHGIYFTHDDWQLNVESGKRAMLVNFPDIPFEKYPKSHKDYISYGEAHDEHTGYKCSIRDRWYIVPSVWVPDTFFLRRNNLYPKFVLNRCGAVSTDTMHRMKFYDQVDPNDVLLSYYNSISFAFTEICGRSYGGGVLEILPGEMRRIQLPVVKNVDPQLKRELLSYVDTIVRNDENIELALDRVDKELLQNELGIDRNVCITCRMIWKKLQRRRLERGNLCPKG